MKITVSVLFAVAVSFVSAQEIEPNNLFSQANEFPAGITRWEGNQSANQDSDWFLISGEETLDGTARFSVSYDHDSDRRGFTGHVSLEAYSFTPPSFFIPIAVTGNVGEDDRFNQHEVSFQMEAGTDYLLRAIGTGAQRYTLDGCSPGSRYGPSEGISNEELLRFVNAYRVDEELQEVAAVAVSHPHFIESGSRFYGVLIVHLIENIGDSIKRARTYAISCEQNLGKSWKLTVLPWMDNQPQFKNVKIGQAPDGSLFIAGDSQKVFLWQRCCGATWKIVDHVQKTLGGSPGFGNIFADLELTFTPESLPIVAFADYMATGSAKRIYRLRIGIGQDESVNWTFPFACISRPFADAHLEIISSPADKSHRAISFAKIRQDGQQHIALAIWSFSESSEPELLGSITTTDLLRRSGGVINIDQLEATIDSDDTIHIVFRSILPKSSLLTVRFSDNEFIQPPRQVTQRGSKGPFLAITDLPSGMIQTFFLTSTDQVFLSELPDSEIFWTSPRSIFTSTEPVSSPDAIFSNDDAKGVRGFTAIDEGGNLMIYPHFDLSDQDGDGRSALRELAEGTHPNKVDSVPPPTFFPVEHDGEWYPGFKFHRAEELTFSAGGIYSQGSIQLLVEGSRTLNEDSFRSNTLYAIESIDHPGSPGQTLSTVRSRVPFTNLFGVTRLFYRTRVLRTK